MLLRKKWVRELLGLNYIYNKRSKEIHNTKNKKTRCFQEKISDKNRKYITFRRAKRMMLKNNVNGCRYCMPKFDKG